MRARDLIPVVTVVLTAAVLSGCGGGKSIFGAGASFPQPVYDQWSADLTEADGLTVNYNPIGSGGGIAQMTAGTVDFGGSDTAMDEAELKAAQKKGDPLHIPSVFGAIAVAYNVRGVRDGLRLDGPTLAAIFQGDIRRWDDPRIRRLNATRNLPDEAITTIHRADNAGTTMLFTSYLAAHSERWRTHYGSDKSVKWPVGMGAAKNAGMAASLKQTDGAIGYIEFAFAKQNGFATAALKNSAGNWVQPSAASTSAAGAGIEVPDDLRFSAVDSANPRAYPIASATFLLVFRDLCAAGIKPRAASITKRFIEYGLGPGQQVAQRIGFAPLPADLLRRSRANVDKLECDGRPLESFRGEQ